MRVLAGLVLAVLVTAPVSGSQYGFPWRGTVPVTITITDHTDPSWRPYIEQAAADWSLSPVIEVVVKPSDGVCSVKAKATICNGYAGLGSTRPAWTVYDTHGGYLTNADIFFNQSYVDGYTNPEGYVFPPYTPDQRAHMVCHEMAHALGLLTDHECSENTVWQAHPTQTDYDQLLVVYGG